MKPPPDDPSHRQEQESDLPVVEQAKQRLKALEALQRMKQQGPETLSHDKENDREKNR